MSEYEQLIRQVNECKLCTLSQKRNLPVPGEGSLNADIVFIGEGPGFYEDQQGRPFVGAAGQLLENLLESIGLNREDVYITNMVKCRPPNNRDPLPSEIDACRPYLDRQLEIINPKVIVTLGRYSFAKFFPGVPISKGRGVPQKWNNLLIYPVYHPAAALRNGKFRSILESDFQELPRILEDKFEDTNHSENENPRKIELF
ncbi:MAG: uracil-DNA glycosylase [SAR202 cluster bacterium]|jgi:DNA polymerase|nr:uracil-DNA glycosylase [SAR202 cluster bacterium]